MEGNDRCANILPIVRMQVAFGRIRRTIADYRGLTLCNIKVSAKRIAFCFTAMPTRELALRRCLLVV